MNTMITASNSDKGKSIMANEYYLHSNTRDSLIELLNEVANTVGMMQIYSDFDPVENDLYDLIESVSGFQTHLTHWYLEPGNTVRMIGDPSNYGQLSEYSCPDDALGQVLEVSDDAVEVSFRWTLELPDNRDEHFETAVWVDYNDVELE